MSIEELMDNLTTESANEFDIDKEIITLLKEFYIKNDIEVKTHIDKKILMKLIRLKLYADSINEYSKDASKFIDKFIELLMVYSLSVDRMGRKELFDAIKQLKNNTMIDNNEEIKHKFLR